jgi:signal transduction histidine kinase
MQFNAELCERSYIEPECMLQAVIDVCAPNLAILNNAGIVLYVNKAWGILADQQSSTANRNGVGLNYLKMCKDIWGKFVEQKAALAAGLCRVLSGQETEFSHEYFWHSPALQRWFKMRALRFDLPGVDRASWILVTHEDISERKQTEETLRDLGSRLIGAQEEERRRIARELHDGLNQKMALLSIELEQFAQRIPDWQSSLRVCVQDLWATTQEISSEIHRLSYQLHPFKLDQLGLVAAVKSFCDELTEHQEITIEFRHREIPATLPNAVTLCLFRIVQEALRNVIKHSGSREAQVVLERVGQSICLSVSDTGRGFDTVSPKMQNGLGFISMRERLRSVGGEVSIHSQPSRGTQIEVSIPLEEL